MLKPLFYFILKRGVSWQITSHEITKPVDRAQGRGETYRQVHIQILEDDSPQDANSVVALLLESIATLKKGHPEVKTLWIKSGILIQIADKSNFCNRGGLGLLKLENLTGFRPFS